RKQYYFYLNKEGFFLQRDSAQRDAERERRLRIDSETRAKQALQEANRCRSRLKLLTQEFARHALKAGVGVSCQNSFCVPEMFIKN
ncbi:hypothetical protein ABEB36_012895, partial [Hypothenemus hampei]